MANLELAASELYQQCKLDDLAFHTTDELEPLDEAIGQARAMEAVRFGTEIVHAGYNIFALGPTGTGKRSTVLDFLKTRAAGNEAPDDWCYVNNFDEPHKPKALKLPTGRGREFCDDMERTIDDIQIALSEAFQGEEYRDRSHSLQEEVEMRQRQIIGELQDRARALSLAMVQTPAGIAFAPLDAQGSPMSPEQLTQLSEQEREAIVAKGEELEKKAKQILGEAPRLRSEIHKRVSELDFEIAGRAVKPFFEGLAQKYQEAGVQDYLGAVERDVIENHDALLSASSKRGIGEVPAATGANGRITPASGGDCLLRRYRVNLLVGHDGETGAPVYYEDHPTFVNLAGRVDYAVQTGMLVTDFNMIQAGALHKANGGYLVVDMLKLLMQPFAWEALKRAIRAREARIESPEETIGIIRPANLEPEPIPLNIKVVLMGSRLLYFALRDLDPDFAELFKVPADFESDMDRSPENQQLYTRLVATLAKKDGLLPFDRGAVARIIERSSRLIGDGRKLSVHMRSIADLLREAHYWALQNRDTVVREEHVQRATTAQEYRSSRLRERVLHEIDRGTILIETGGTSIGQVNGLAVFSAGDFQFGRPTRITARARMGRGEVIDIEREVQLGEANHSKGVLILAGFLAGRYAKKVPLSLSASLVFEQSYGGVDGDSASLAELLALLSSIADIPVKQSLAVTGSINQHGQVQPVGAVTEKIEAFFDVCAGQGLTGSQGVIIPAANVQHLMLRQDVVDAVARGEFHVYPVKVVDEAAELLTGLQAGDSDQQGNYPPDTLNGKVGARLEEYASQRRQFGPEIKVPEHFGPSEPRP